MSAIQKPSAEQRLEWIAAILAGDALYGAVYDDLLVQQVIALKGELAHVYEKLNETGAMLQQRNAECEEMRRTLNEVTPEATL